AVAAASTVTVNELPSAERSPGVAPPPATATGPRQREKAEPPLRSEICSADHAASEIVPVWPPAVADAAEKTTLPKFASGCVRHEARPRVQSDGASAIHSAELVSTALAVTCLEAEVPCVTFWSAKSTVVPVTVTEALTVSPGETATDSGTEAAGSTSYQV